MAKKRNPQHPKKKKTKLTGWSALFQVVRTSTSRNLQKKRREIRLMTKKKNPPTPKKEKNETYRLVRDIPSRPNVYKLKSTKKKKRNQVNGKKKKPPRKIKQNLSVGSRSALFQGLS